MDDLCFHWLHLCTGAFIPSKLKSSLSQHRTKGTKASALQLGLEVVKKIKLGLQPAIILCTHCNTQDNISEGHMLIFIYLESFKIPLNKSTFAYLVYDVPYLCLSTIKDMQVQIINTKMYVAHVSIPPKKCIVRPMVRHINHYSQNINY